MRAPLLASCLFATILVAACGSEDPAGPATPDAGPTQSIRYELHPWTKELTADTLAALRDLGPADGIVRFAGTPAQLADLKRGDVLLAGASGTTPRGMLRQVLEVRTEAGGLTVVTQPVAVQLAFRSLHARARTAPIALVKNDAGGVTPQDRYSKAEKYGSSTKLDWRVYDQDGNRDTKDDQLYVTGEITGEVVVEPYIDLDWLDDPAKAAEQVGCALTAFIACGPDLPDVKVGVDASAKAGMMIDAEGAATKSFVSQEFPIDDSTIPLPEIVIPPVVIKPEIDFIAQISGSATSRFHAHGGISYEAKTGASIGLTSGPEFVKPEFTRTFDPPAVEASLSANVKAAIGPRLSLRFWDTFGPQISVRGFATVHADTQKDPCLGVDLGAEVGVGLSLRIPWSQFGAEELGKLLDLDGDIYNHQFPPAPIFTDPNVFTGACSALPTSVFPPGTGPSESVYNAPAFTPWSKRIGEEGTRLYQPPSSGENAEHVLHTEQSLDGSWLVTGDGIYGGLKIAESGQLLWARNLTLAAMNDDELEEDGPGTYLAQARDTDLWFAASRFTIGKLDQDGDVVWAKRLDPLGPDGQIDQAAARTFGLGLSPSSIVPLTDGGALITYQIRDSQFEGPAVFLRVDENGKLVWSRALRLDGTDRSYVPSVLPVGNDFLFAGFSSESTTKIAHVARFGADGVMQWSKRLDVCAKENVQPTSAILLANGSVAIAGSYDYAKQRSFVANLPVTGDVVNGNAFGPIAQSDFLSAMALAELPISGVVTAARDALYTGSSIRLSRHDGQGHVQAAQNFQIAANAQKRALLPGSLRLTTDGGLLLFAHSSEADAGHAGVWISKLYAKDLTADFAGTAVASTPTTDVPEASCDFGLSDSPQILTDFPMASRDATAATKSTPVPALVDTYLPH